MPFRIQKSGCRLQSKAKDVAVFFPFKMGKKEFVKEFFSGFSSNVVSFSF
jgi:hypothetical protein